MSSADCTTASLVFEQTLFLSILWGEFSAFSAFRNNHFNSAFSASRNNHFSSAFSASRNNHFNSGFSVSRNNHFSSAFSASRNNHFSSAFSASRNNHFTSAFSASRNNHFNSAFSASRNNHSNSAFSASRNSHFSSAFSFIPPVTRTSNETTHVLCITSSAAECVNLPNCKVTESGANGRPYIDITLCILLILCDLFWLAGVNMSVALQFLCRPVESLPFTVQNLFSGVQLCNVCLFAGHNLGLFLCTYLFFSRQASCYLD